MQILNRKSIIGPWPHGAVYVGRGTPLGNQFVIGVHGSRDEVIEQYGAWLDYWIARRDPAVLTMLYGMDENTPLICSCAPFPCHAQHIIRVLPGLERPAHVISMDYAGIGSRKTPPAVLHRMTKVARRLEEMGYTLRSGGAVGADTAFELGAMNKEIYLPWAGFNGNPSVLSYVSIEARAVASCVHPAMDRLSDPVKLLMGRNAYQVLGHDLQTPSDFVLCWTPDGAESEAARSHKTGGTGLAIALASRWKIPVFNMARADALDRLKTYLEGQRPTAATSASPCIGHCSTVLGDDTCRGCLRTVDEVSRWISMSDEERIGVNRRIAALKTS